MDKITEQINQQKAERNAIILAHNYQRPDVQDIADFTGDSLALSRRASEIREAEVIVFCGVWFMAETAAMLCPDKTVLIPEKESICPMARMVTPDEISELKKTHPHAPVVTYINSTAEVKACSDVCCTSSNAVEIVNSLDADTVIFVPDQYLGDYVSRHTDKRIVLAHGYCPTHAKIRLEDIQRLKEAYPNAIVMVHPECRPDVAAASDRALSTSGMCAVANETCAQTIIVGTETGLLHRLQKENPDKTFIPATDKALCPNMKRITLEKILWSLERTEYTVTVDKTLREKALLPIQRMLGGG